MRYRRRIYAIPLFVSTLCFWEIDVLSLTLDRTVTYAVARSALHAYPQGHMATLGQNIERLRVAAGHKNATAFARSIGISAATLHDWESGRYQNLRLDSLIRVARGIPCAVEELLIGVDSDYDVVIREMSSTRQNKVGALTPPVTEADAQWRVAGSASTGDHDASTASRRLSTPEGLRAELEAAERLDNAAAIIDYATRIIRLAGGTPDRTDVETPPLRADASSHDHRDAEMRERRTGAPLKRRRGGRS